MKRARLWLSLGLPVLAIIWIAWHGFANDPRVYSSGRMSAAHAVIERECATCHVEKAGQFSRKAANESCLACHDGPVHHASQPFTPECATCHTEHRGRINLIATSNQSCTECHGDLKTSGGPVHFEAHIRSFENGHPQFRAVREGQRDQGTIALNHSAHMKPIRRGPNGPIVQLECSDCHRPSAVKVEWHFQDSRYVEANANSSPDPGPGLHAPFSDRALMAPPKFATSCASCHLLEFDKRFTEGVPHDKPEIVHAFVIKKFQEYIAAHPAEVRVVRDPGRNLTGKPIPPDVRVLTPAQWVSERTAEAEELLWRKTCKQCHTLSARGEAPPKVADSNITARWMSHARFDHDAHRGFSCTSCHAQATMSTQTSDILLPGIATCQTCHAPGPERAESRCYECHVYHDWSQRKEVTPKFMLPALRTGGR